MPFYTVTVSAGDKVLSAARVEAKGKTEAKTKALEAMKQHPLQRIKWVGPVAGEISVSVEKSDLPEWLLKGEPH